MISVIVPTYNSQKTIEECVQAILNQKVPEEFELIIVDDASKDDTEKILEKYSNKIIYLKNKKNKGPAFSRNIGAKKAKGKIVVFTDSDCIAAKNWLSEMIKPFEDEKVAAVQGAYKTKQKELIARFSQEEIEQRYELLRKAKNLDWVGSYSAAYSKNIFLEEGGFDESFPIASGEDPDLSFRVAKKGHKIVFNEKAIVYHTHPNNLGWYLRTKFFRAYYRVILYKKHPQKAVKDSYTPQLLKLRIIGFPLFTIAFVLTLINSITSFVIAILFFKLFYILTALPFALKAMKKDLPVGILSPLILFLRDLYFALGLVIGTIKSVFK